MEYDCLFGVQMPLDTITRRALLKLLAGGAVAPLTGCSLLCKGLRPRCPHDPSISDPQGPLTIDVHAHIFNGSDLQVSEFLSKVVGRSVRSELRGFVDAFSDLLQFLSWRLAPSAEKEFAALDAYDQMLASCNRVEHTALLERVRQKDYDLGRTQLQAALNASLRNFGTPLQSRGQFSAPFLRGVQDEIRDMPPLQPSWRQHRAARQQTTTETSDRQTLQGRTSARAYIDFALHFFAHRYVNALDYLETYSAPSRRKVDLLVASLVDYDWWLARGRRTEVSLAQQVALMERIAITTQGRVHGFVPFCPFREAMTSRGSAAGESLTLVRDAIENRGFLGVKLYPPMGFAPYGNGALQVWRGKASLPEASQERGFGERLDAAMRSLFVWCRANGVPVMAHTNHSNGPYDEFEDLAGAQYWDRALKEFPGLTISFGHFGDTDTADHGGERAKAFVALMTSAAGSPGRKTFADSGFFADALTQTDKLRDTLLDLYGAAEGGLLAERLMYGSDWEMLATQVDADQYFYRFGTVLEYIDGALRERRVRGLLPSEAFFGWNAVHYLGLIAGSKARQRIEKFYRVHRVPVPNWMGKVDRATLSLRQLEAKVRLTEPRQA
jgi:predicted TIM-barrel fold metal-dependent hydrolase